MEVAGIFGIGIVLGACLAVVGLLCYYMFFGDR